MITSIDAEKAFDKIQYTFIIKKTPESRHKKKLNIIKAIYDKLTANIILDGGKLKAFPLRQEQDKGVHSHCYYST